MTRGRQHETMKIKEMGRTAHVVDGAVMPVLLIYAAPLGAPVD
jgi:hypothetical protein